METGVSTKTIVAPIAANVPGSVQVALLTAGVLPDWNVALRARECEWVENRHWIYQTTLPASWLENAPQSVVLKCLGLDFRGVVHLNGVEIGAFCGTFTPHHFDLRPHLESGDNRLQIVFEESPRWLGQTGYTSRMTDWKARFNYTWDWTARLVQIGIWDAITLEIGGADLVWNSVTQAHETNGAVDLRAEFEGARVRFVLSRAGRDIAAREASREQAQTGFSWDVGTVELWQPNGCGERALYELRAEVFDAQNELLEVQTRRIGFRNIEWHPCEGAPEGALPWICVVNGQPLFLQGANWTPIRPNFADVTPEDYRARLECYRDLGFNCLRVWGGAFLEKTVFYDLCDELGILVWQEFPLSSSGVENWPPEDAQSRAELGEIARSYIARRSHHTSLFLWCGGNELQGALDGSKVGTGKPCDISHPLLADFARIVAENDPTRRFLPASASGPRFKADAEDFGKGWHHDVHGPWAAMGAIADEWTHYWANDDALFRSETGAPGASGADLTRHFAGDLPVLPVTLENPLWRRSSWWIENHEFKRERGREPDSLEEYVEWSQQRQAQALQIAAQACKNRFPRCGGFLVWMGHDSFPCAANTAILDFWGRPKPAALALREVFCEL